MPGNEPPVEAPDPEVPPGEVVPEAPAPANAALAQQVQGANPEGERRAQVLGLIEAQTKQFALALASTSGTPMIDPAKFSRVAYSAIRKSPMLMEASWPSLAGALMACAQLGLEPSGPLGQAYLVPFRDGQRGVEVQLIIGYQGLIELAYRSGRVGSIYAETIHENDQFDYELGTNAHIFHKPPLSERGPMIGVYAIANLIAGAQVFEVMSREDVEKRKKRSKAQGDRSPWATDYEAMARKTAVRQLFKWLPSSVEDHPALGADGGVFHQIPETEEDYSNPEIIDVDGVEEVPANG